MEEEIFTFPAAVLSWPQKQHDLASVIMMVPADDLEESVLGFLFQF